MKNKLLWALNHGFNFVVFFLLFLALSNWWLALIAAMAQTLLRYLINRELDKANMENDETTKM